MYIPKGQRKNLQYKFPKLSALRKERSESGRSVSKAYSGQGEC